MNEKDLEKIGDIEFKMTKKTSKLLVDMLEIKMLIDNDELSEKDKQELNKQFGKLILQFKSELQQLNPTQVACVRAYLNDKKDKES